MDGGCAKGSVRCHGICRLNGLAYDRDSPQYCSLPSHFPYEKREINKRGLPCLQYRGKVGKAGAEALMAKSHQRDYNGSSQAPGGNWHSLSSCTPTPFP
ncbi:uncharacterized [Tachysurus ichikawai]